MAGNARFLEFRHQLFQRPVRVYDLFYSDIEYDFPGVMKGLEEFIGIKFNQEQEEAKVESRKATSDELCFAIEGWQAICTQLVRDFPEAKAHLPANGCECKKAVEPICEGVPICEIGEYGEYASP